MKIKLTLITLLILLVCAGSFSWKRYQKFQQNTVSIALIGPMTGKSHAIGTAMKQGVELYLEEMERQKNGPDDLNIEIIIYDDQGNKEIAVQQARQIAAENKVLMVLGHHFSFASESAGKIYKRNRIPALTGSSTADYVTHNNEWYFRATSTNSFKSKFIANFINITLKKNSSSIVYVDDKFGSTFARSFEEAAEVLGITIKNKWAFDRSLDLDQEAERIASEINKVDDPGILFLPIYRDPATRMVRAIKNLDKSYEIIGHNQFSSNKFIESLKNFPEEKKEPGSLTEGVYGISPFILEIANEMAYGFGKNFEKKYHKTPDYISASYFDAALVAIEAIKRAKLKNNKNLLSSRKKIRDTLEGIYNKASIKGVTGILFFDSERNMNIPPIIGSYHNQEFHAYYSQYQQLTELKNIDNIFQKNLDGEILFIGNSFMQKGQVINSGISVNSISNLNIDKSQYDIDFNIWFHHKGEFNEHNIVFPDATTTINLGKPVFEKIENNLITRQYRVKAQFRHNFDFPDLAQNNLILPVRFHHNSKTRDKLIFVSDDYYAPENLLKNKNNKNRIIDKSIWKIAGIELHQDILKFTSSMGVPENFNQPTQAIFSRFNAEIKLAHQNKYHVIINLLIPSLAIIILLMLIIIPTKRPGMRIFITSLFFCGNSLFHLYISWGFQINHVFLTEEYFIYGIFLLSICSFIKHLSLTEWKKTFKIHLDSKNPADNNTKT
jgi:branched-chain amino acid transport system substrate-binding protein